MKAYKHLPYVDKKDQGAPDFYYAIQATFSFIQQNLGKDKLIEYWEELGNRYMEPVWQSWREEGIQGIAAYWREFFEAEPGSDVEVEIEGDEVRLEVKTCPAIRHLREGGREILEDFCQHCYYITHAAASNAGYTVRVRGGNGSCTQRFLKKSPDLLPQNMEDIKKC